MHTAEAGMPAEAGTPVEADKPAGVAEAVPAAEAEPVQWELRISCRIFRRVELDYRIFDKTWFFSLFYYFRVNADELRDNYFCSKSV